MRIFLYMLFVLVAAPIDIILNVTYGLLHSDNKLLLKPLVEGALFIYAFILSIETLMRIAMKREAIVHYPLLKYAAGASICVVLVFIIFYMGVIWPSLRHGEAESFVIVNYFEIASLILALSASQFSFHVCEHQDA